MTRQHTHIHFWFSFNQLFSPLGVHDTVHWVTQEGHPACNKLGVDRLVVTIWLEPCNKVENGDILAPTTPDPPGKRPQNRQKAYFSGDYFKLGRVLPVASKWDHLRIAEARSFIGPSDVFLSPNRHVPRLLTSIIWYWPKGGGLAGKVSKGLVSWDWPCMTFNSGISTYRLKARERQMSTPRSMVDFTFFYPF